MELNRLHIFEAAQRFPSAEALRVGGKSFSFSQLASVCSAVCTKLEQMFGTPRPNSTIPAMVATSELHTVVFVLAAFQSGRTFALLHRNSTDAEIAKILKTHEKFRLVDSESLRRLVEGAQLRFHPVSLSTVGHNGTKGACILFTSGSSGAPKGVVLSESAIVNAAKGSAAHLGWQPNDKWILHLPLSHIGGLSIVFRCLLAGKCAVLFSKFDVQEIVRAIEQNGATLLSTVPTGLQRLLASEHWVTLRKLRFVLLGGASISDELRSHWRKKQISVLETYGMTETASQVATSIPAELGADGGGETAGALTPLPHVKVQVVDADGASLPAGSMGTIVVEGDGVMDGYLDMPHCNNRFVTSDLGYLDRLGRLRVIGRKDDMIITGGENVHPAMVENLLRQVPGVIEAVVFGVPDEQFGEVVAAQIYGDEKQFDRDALEGNLLRLFSTRHRPRLVSVDAQSDMPLLENGKLNRRQAISDAGVRLRPVQGFFLK